MHMEIENSPHIDNAVESTEKILYAYCTIQCARLIDDDAYLSR